MDKDIIKRLLLLLVITATTVAIQFFIIKIIAKNSIKKQILSNVFMTLILYVSAMYSIYKEYRNLTFYIYMSLILFIIINSIFTLKGSFYDSREIKSKYKAIIAIIGFALIGLLWVGRVNIYLFLTIGLILILFLYFIDYKSYNKHYKNNI